MNYLIAPVQQSGSPNVPITESTGGQLQGTLGNEGNIFGSSASGCVQTNPSVETNNVIISGNITTNNQLIVSTAFQSGVVTAGLVITPGNTGGIVVNSGVLATQPSTVIVAGSGFTVSTIAANSGGGLNTPMGFFWLNVPTSGSPWVKVPFYNS